MNRRQPNWRYLPTEAEIAHLTGNKRFHGDAALPAMSRLLPVLALSLCLQLLACTEGEEPAPAAAAPAPGIGEPNTSPDPSGNPDGDPDGNPGVKQPASPACAQAAGSGAFQDLFSLERLHNIRIHISEVEWTALLNDFDQNPRNEVYRLADFVYEDGEGIAERIENVGFRLRGNYGSRVVFRPEQDGQLVRAHFKIKFNERFDEDEGAYGPPSADIPEIPANRERLFRSVRSLNLKHNRFDPGKLREIFVFDTFHRMGAMASRGAFAGLYLKIGEDRERYFGVYHMIEALDSSWVRRHCQGKNGFLFKNLLRSNPGGAPTLASLAVPDHLLGPFVGSIGMEITDPPAVGEPLAVYRPNYDLKTRKGSFDQAERELNSLIRLLISNPTKTELEDKIDIEALLRAQAVAAFVGKFDGYWPYSNNYYLLLDPLSGKWVFVPYDYDRIFGTQSEAPFAEYGSVLDTPSQSELNPVLMDRVMAIPEFRRMFLGFVAELADRQSGLFYPDNAEARLISLRSVIRDHTGGYDALPNVEYWNDNNVIMDFLRRRTAIAEQETGANRPEQ